MKRFFNLILFIFLTLLTQIGGIVFLLCFPIFAYFKGRIKNKFSRLLMQIFSFCFFYMVFTISIVPPLAKMGGRVPLPVRDKTLKPLNLLTCVLNRHYVVPSLKKTVLTVADKIELQYPNTVILYLDANFPFLTGFPLLPHLSHNDGEKIDFSFCYKNKKTLSPVNDAPSFIGYGICEEPQENEENRPENCERLGYYQYNMLRKIVPQFRKNAFLFDAGKTRTLIALFAEEKNVEKIFLEPHLKTRLLLGEYAKIRFHGCQAVRHDDHFHVQLK